MVLIRKTILSIVLVLLVVSMLSPFWTGVASAQTKGDYTIYLPLVSKNYLEWLEILNQYRRAEGLNPVVSNNNMSYELSLHIKYLLACPQQKDDKVYGMHGENVCSTIKEATPEGASAARQSNLLWSTDLKITQKHAIDVWMDSADHRVHMLNPDLVESGFSLICDAKNCFAGLNVLGGIQ